MQFINLKRQYNYIADRVNAKVFSVLESQQYIMGSEVQELEERLAQFVGVKHALTCSSGTDALVIALMAYNLKKDDAVFVPITEPLRNEFSHFADCIQNDKPVMTSGHMAVEALMMCEQISEKALVEPLKQ